MVKIILLHLSFGDESSANVLLDEAIRATIAAFSDDTMEEPSLHELHIAVTPNMATAWQCLNKDERVRARHIRDLHHHNSYVIAHGALRLILSMMTGIEPEALKFGHGPHGKPALVPAVQACAFNMSYRNGLIAVALSTKPIGVDVEWITDNIDHDGIAQRFFTKTEQQYLQSVSGHERLQRFFEIWTLKESVIKAQGVGLDAMPLIELFDKPKDINKLPMVSWITQNYALSVAQLIN